MRNIQFTGTLMVLFGVLSMSPAAAKTECSTLLDHRFLSLQGKPVDLCQYHGKILLVVNTASYCGYTEQYKGLQALYDRYRDRGLVVLGFPANDFGKQEPGTNAEVADFQHRRHHFPDFCRIEARHDLVHQQKTWLDCQRPCLPTPHRTRCYRCLRCCRSPARSPYKIRGWRQYCCCPAPGSWCCCPP